MRMAAWEEVLVVLTLTLARARQSRTSEFGDKLRVAVLHRTRTDGSRHAKHLLCLLHSPSTGH